MGSSLLANGSTTIIVPFVGHARVALEGLSEPVDQPDEERPVPEPESTGEAYRGPSEDVEDLDDVLAVIAPQGEDNDRQTKKTNLEEIVQELDEDLIKRALWRTASSSSSSSEEEIVQPSAAVVVGDPERAALKEKMKKMLRGMIDDR